MKIQPGQLFRVAGDDRVRECVRCEPRVSYGRIVNVVDDANGERFFAHLCEPAEETHDPPFVVGDRVCAKGESRAIGEVTAVHFAHGEWGIDFRQLSGRVFTMMPASAFELAPVIDEPAPRPFDSRGRFLGYRRAAK